MLVTVTLHDDYFITTEERKAKRLIADFGRLGLNNIGNTYEYEQVDGTRVTGTFLGFDGLNVKFRKDDGTTFLAPVIDMGDGSLVTEYLTRVRGRVSLI